MKYIFPVLIALILIPACDDNTRLTYQEQLELDEKIIQDYLDANNIDAQRGDFGLFYTIEDSGTGDTYPTSNSTVIINYKGYFPDGSVFDERDAAQLSLRQTISGWQIGIPLFKKGGKGRLFLPSSLAYGEFGSGSIPGNQVIFFDIELINFL